MEFRSKRFQSVRPSSTNQSQEAPLTRHPYQSNASATKLLCETQTKTLGRQSPKNRKPAQNALYACILTCFRFIVACLQALICQNKELQPQTPYSTRNGVSAAFARFKSNLVSGITSHLPKPNKKKTQATLSKSRLYSSDSEEDDEEDLYTGTLLRNNEYHISSTGDHFTALDDYDLPIVCLIDNVIYFFHLYFANYPAFLFEFSRYFQTKGFPTKRVVYGHNLNPKLRRPSLVWTLVEFLKRRKRKEIMTRVYGDAHKQWVLRVALASRLLIFFMQLVAVNLPEIFKHNNDGFRFIPEETYGQLLDPLVNATFGGYVNWDAHYFLHISVYGYTTESILAFFPLLPMLLYLPSRILYLLMGSFISLSSIVVVLGVVLNTWLFVQCADNIYELAKFRSGASRQFITTACVMFCFNPASIFFSGLYTETLFAYLTSSVILQLLRGETEISLGCAALSCLCRSNGILNVGFILALDLQKQLRNLFSLREVVRFLLGCVIKLIFAVSPFVLFQVYGRYAFCSGERVYDDPADVPLYCIGKGFGWLPYSYIQEKYWNVGFLKYFQLKQLPNFILAAPVLYVLGNQSWITGKLSITQLLKGHLQYIYPLFNAVHGLFLTCFCFLCIHVQVSTRMIMAACPYIYVYLAGAHEDEVEKFRKREISLPSRSLAITLWCAMYYIVGTIAFSLGLPWT